MNKGFFYYIYQKFTAMRNLFLSSLIGVCLILTTSCGGKYAATEKIYKKKAGVFAADYKSNPAKTQLDKINIENREWIGSTNFGVRVPNYVVIHHTAQDSIEQTIRTFHSERAQVSAHYVIGREGEIVQMVNDLFRSHHAGLGKWGTNTDMNSSSIGIELDNNGTSDPWPDAQIESLLELLDYLKKTYKIPQGNFIGHLDYAPARKIDPANFPWDRLAEKGFGFWYDKDREPAPENFDEKLALRIIGYDVSNMDAAIKAFKKHFIQEDEDTSELDEEEKAVLYNLMLKYL